MQPGDVLLAFSDGLLESHDEHGEQLEVPGLLALVRDAREAGAEQDEIVRRTLAQARSRAVDWERDDVTLVALSLAPGEDRATIPTPRPTPTPVP